MVRKCINQINFIYMALSVQLMQTLCTDFIESGGNNNPHCYVLDRLNRHSQSGCVFSSVTKTHCCKLHCFTSSANSKQLSALPPANFCMNLQRHFGLITDCKFLGQSRKSLTCRYRFLIPPPSPSFGTLILFKQETPSRKKRKQFVLSQLNQVQFYFYAGMWSVASFLR